MAQPFTIEPDPNTLDHPPAFLANGGAVGKLLLSLDAASSPLGPPDAWSASLKTTMATLLPAKAQIVLFWGAEFVALYNDAYAPSIGDKHPRALGRPAIENWRELWDDLEPLLRGVYETGETFAAKDRPFYIERHGRGETVYFDVSYSAVRETDGSVGGVLCIVTETTERVRFERRQAFLLELGQTLPSLADPLEIEATALRRLGEELGASRIFFGEDNGDGMTFQVHRDYLHDGRSAVGRHRYLSFGATLSGELHAGRSVAREDLAGERGMSLDEAASRARLGLGATLHVPVLRHGRLEALLAIHFAHPQALGEDPRRLAEEAAKLAWTSLTHARAELALRTSSAQLAAMFDQASAGIAVCDRNWRFTRVNDRYCEIASRSRETLLGLRMQDILDPADFALPAAPGGATGAAFEMSGRYVRPDGDTVWVQNQVTPLVDEQHAASGLLCVCMDISARVRAENELRELNESLEERVATMLAQRESALAQLHEARKMEMVGQLTGGIAHDFNNLLTPIMASLELIRRRLDDARSTDLIDGALQSAERARNLVGRLLTFARRQTLKPQAVALRELVEGMHDLIERSLGPTIEVRIEIPERLPAVVVDPHQFELAILNLAVNARDAMGEGGRLEIGARTDLVIDGAVDGLGAGRYVCLEVADNGGGMPAEVLARCMEPFFSTKGVGKGTGLGLSMVQGLVAQSGGGLGIHSEIGKGTRVSIWLPITAEQTQSTAESCPDAPEALRPTHVLLVDDDRMVRYTTALLLGDLGYQVSEAASAEEALGEVERGLAPDLLVTDHLMADKTGVQLAEELRQRFPQLPVLVITGYANLRPEQLNGFEVLTKPFRHNELAERLARLLEASP
ncbi:hybrid sensor histidine kinase/response regulator [Pseudomonas aeruginosa]|uniref:PAS domain-containing protein n=1 Tax=Pseudomonas aeruginosa TaxID=287 RepID=UPI000772AFD6|nr:PAS domain-containing protein [Pseudomonas aeruginosa]KXE43635.1 hybrid sensor histidine kinase/response regulator [Pseudomonas aeruginosa]